MKIVCTKLEFAELIRNCERRCKFNGCGGCVFYPLYCGDGVDDEVIEKRVDIQIEE